ncbi:MAG: FAD-dependent oxidoreductase [Candidatus Peregrinibacteria bacterium]|nr:FAD-dependent oxidoreductase [Candidatus Peregrinibacteria bacterium]
MPSPRVNDFAFKQSKVLKTKILAKDVIEITFEKPKKRQHAPGQFATIRIADHTHAPCFRAYSIMENPENKEQLQVAVKKVKNGRGSTWLQTVKEGDVLDILYPMGYFGFPEKTSSNLNFIATGTGVVPILNLIENIKDTTTNAKLYFGVRNEKDLFYEERIKKLEKSLPNFKSTITLSQPSNKWKGNIGRVTKHIEKETFPKNAQFFICGNGNMIKAVREILEKKGVSTKNIFFEDFNE